VVPRLPQITITDCVSGLIPCRGKTKKPADIVMSSPPRSSYTVRYFDDGSKHSVPREAIVVSTVEGAAGDSSDPQADLPVGCFVVVDGREAVIVPRPGDGEISGATRATKRPRGIG
jgi:hypothetical protein